MVVASEQNMIKRLLKDSGLLRSDVDNIQTMQEVRRSHQSSFRNYS